ncbi:MAG TPA: thiamine pyrophosphate-dependent enzyme [Acetobacteraceae bacterium]|nr:thiamine pyrophosphate-dependent enzyme [Acetobacteraceae bacterium]
MADFVDQLADRAGAPIERPLPRPAGNALFGSDVVAETLRALEIPFIALNPGASYRGLHDSLVNYLGNVQPQMLLCLHEEHAVAIAHGYAKVTGKPMAVAVHSNVGLMHGTMAIFNAWCDRMPVLVLGATGPVDAPKRRPWIDWIHTARDQGALIRSYTKWDDQPASPEAAREALLRAYWMMRTAPMGPVYVNLDAGMQEAPLGDPLPPIDAPRFVPSVAPAAPTEQIARVLEILHGAQQPVILMGRGSRSEQAWANRVALAEALNARVVTDLKIGAVFPTDHPLHAGAPATFPVQDAAQAIAAADVILSLDWVDLAGALKAACGTVSPSARVINVTMDHQIHNGWSMDHQALAPADVFMAADADTAIAALLQQLPARDTKRYEPVVAPEPAAEPGHITVAHMGIELRRAVGVRPTSLLHVSLSWNSALWPFRHPLDYIGSDGGGGIGGGPGIAVGAALALRASGRLPLAVCGDGDFLMGATSLWTAVHYNIPLMIVVANNRSFFNDELHQERVARMRNRPVENRWIGQRIGDPEIDLASLARAQGAVGFGPVTDGADLAHTFRSAIEAVEAGNVAVVDVRVAAGYAPAAVAGLFRG